MTRRGFLQGVGGAAAMGVALTGLSWSTILIKREGYRRNFADFYPEIVARYTEKRLAKILQDPGIVRNRLKVASAIRNAQAYL